MERRDIEHGAHSRAPSADHPPSPGLTTVVRHRCEGGDAAAIEAAEFRHRGQQGGRHDGTDAWDRLQASRSLGEGLMARDEGCDFGIDSLDPALEESDEALNVCPRQ